MADFSQDLYAVAGKSFGCYFAIISILNLFRVPDFCLIPMGTEASVSLQSEGLASRLLLTVYGH